MIAAPTFPFLLFFVSFVYFVVNSLHSLDLGCGRSPAGYFVVKPLSLAIELRAKSALGVSWLKILLFFTD
jgi:hypothetical protein